ncbi:hypothetical protein [Paenibacillus segetis]|uniref:Uncharacterized protein n=1 Tax=Paenibacillus segetis TaxID=1325360 RepID=A0ABQ1YVP1_9BACL|nr:hypothetical protein [Paenibacillus segetis]GGH40614.1 hypothetical protein GCM10008013_50150 [Paenibacillus segetis]
MTYVRSGWERLKKQFPSVIILFLYQLLWGFFLYRLVDTVVTAVLQRYPDPSLSDLSRVLFLIEGQIGLQQNHDIRVYCLILIGMVAIRLLLTPLIQAGILYGLIPQESQKSGLPFFRGMKEFWKPLFFFYILELALILGPAFWIAPKLYVLWPRLLQSGGSLPILLTTGGYVLGWICYGWLIRQCLLFAQFGYLFKVGTWSSLLTCIRHLLPGIGITLILGISTFAVFMLFGAVSWIWTGLLALILQQAHPLFQSIFKVWQVTSQYHLWQTKSQKS